MNLDQLSQLSVEELHQTANEKLASLDTGGAAPRAASARQSSILSEAQFYLDEIERREGREERQRQSKIARRDLILELVVIFLIGLEIVVGVWGGNDQLKALGKIKDGSDQQLVLLQKMNESAGNTATILKTLSDEQSQALTAQQQTLQIITQMNGALQSQLGLTYIPELTMVYNEGQKLLTLENLGKADIYAWGTKMGAEPRNMVNEPRIIIPNGSYSFPIEDQLKMEALKVAKGGSEQVRYDVHIRNAKQKKFTASYFLYYVWKGDQMSVNVQLIGINEGGW